MTIDDTLITYLEKLSMLRLPREDRETVKQDLSDILGYMDQLAQLNTEGVEGLAHPFVHGNVLRDDETRDSAGRDDILANAPRQKDGCFQVPKTVE